MSVGTACAGTDCAAVALGDLENAMGALASAARLWLLFGPRLCAGQDICSVSSVCCNSQGVLFDHLFTCEIDKGKTAAPLPPPAVVV